LALVGVLGVAVVGGIHLYGEMAAAAYRDRPKTPAQSFELNEKIEVELLEARRAEKDFLLRSDPRKADDQVEIGKAVIADIDRLRGEDCRERQFPAWRARWRR